MANNNERKYHPDPDADKVLILLNDFSNRFADWHYNLWFEGGDEYEFIDLANELTEILYLPAKDGKFDLLWQNHILLHEDFECAKREFAEFCAGI